jgi:hypothetical protein
MNKLSPMKVQEGKCYSYIHVHSLLNALQELDLPADRSYVFGYHPHGTFISPGSFNLSPDAYLFSGIISM